MADGEIELGTLKTKAKPDTQPANSPKVVNHKERAEALEKEFEEVLVELYVLARELPKGTTLRRKAGERYLRVRELLGAKGLELDQKLRDGNL